MRIELAADVFPAVTKPVHALGATLLSGMFCFSKLRKKAEERAGPAIPRE
jgi:hypothetical protein